MNRKISKDRFTACLVDSRSVKDESPTTRDERFCSAMSRLHDLDSVDDTNSEIL